MKKIYFCEGIELTPIACAYIRARGADRMSSYGDFAALSEECDEATARFLSKEVSDGVIAPSYSEKALEILRAKRKGTYLVLQMDPNYTPKPMESKEVYGVRFHQQRNDVKIDENLLQNIVSENKELPEGAKRDLLIAMITAKYTQSNSVVYAKDGQAIGIGAGQQSRIHCTRMAGNKADIWHLRQHPKVLSLPFKEKIRRPDRDNADRRLHFRRMGRPDARGKLAGSLHGKAGGPDGRGKESLAGAGQRRLPGFRRFLPVW